LQGMNRYSDFSQLPRDLSQQIFNELVESGYLTEASLGAFRDCDLQVIILVLFGTLFWVNLNAWNFTLLCEKL
jgi:hypothetical protein